MENTRNIMGIPKIREDKGEKAKLEKPKGNMENRET